MEDQSQAPLDEKHSVYVCAAFHTSYVLNTIELYIGVIILATVLSDTCNYDSDNSGPVLFLALQAMCRLTSTFMTLLS